MARFTAKVVQFDYLIHSKWGVRDVDDDDQDPIGNTQHIQFPGFISLTNFVRNRGSPTNGKIS